LATGQRLNPEFYRHLMARYVNKPFERHEEKADVAELLTLVVPDPFLLFVQET
jgi:hypothetical protein